MAATGKADGFANYAIVAVDESAANTLTFKKLETGISLTEKVAWVIARVEYIFAVMGDTILDTKGDKAEFGLSLSNSFSTPAITENTIIDFNRIARVDFGAAASGFLDRMPIVKDFSSLPGGGIIVPPSPLYLFAKCTGAAAATGLVARIHYTLMSLAVDQYWELVEARRVLSS